MKFEDFVNKILVTFYRESGGDRRDQIAYNTLAKKYGIPVEKSFWIDDCAERLLQNGWVKIINDRVDEGMIASITLNGIQQAENINESVLDYPLATPSEVTTIPPPPSLISTFPTGFPKVRLSDILTENPPPSDSPQQEPVVYDSTTWAGPKLVLVDNAVIHEIRIKAKNLKNLIETMRIESNSDSQDLKGLCSALVALCDMAEPELTIIDRILSHPKFNISVTLIAAVATIRSALGI